MAEAVILAVWDGAWGGVSCAGGVTGMLDVVWGSAVPMLASSLACVSPKLRVSDLPRSAAESSRKYNVESPTR